MPWPGSTWTWVGGTINLESAIDWTLTAGPGDGTDIPQTGDTVINSGTLLGYGLIAAAIVNSGTIEASNNSVPGSSTGGELEIQGAVSGTGSMIIAPSATLQLDGAPGAGQTIAFSRGAPGTLILNAPGTSFSDAITGLAVGDAIEFGNGMTITSASVVNVNTIAVVFNGSGGLPGTYDLTDVGFAPGSSEQFSTGVDTSTGDSYVQVVPTLTTLVNFTGPNGDFPSAGLIEDADGDLLGTTEYGGTNTAGSYENLGYGTVFELRNSAGGYASMPTTLVNFDLADGAYPRDALINDADSAGDLFGTASDSSGAAGAGTVFEVTNTGGGSYATGTPTLLLNANASSGAAFYAGLLADADGDLFGAAELGGTSGYGTVFELKNTSGSYSLVPLVNFDNTDGSEPNTSLIAIPGAGREPNLFGTTDEGGDGYGTVFEIKNSTTGYANEPTMLVSFSGPSGDGAYTTAGLIADAAGDLFGTTVYGGLYGDGTVFEIKNSAAGYASTPTTLVSFDVTNGEMPEGGLIADANGDLFGTTYNGGEYSLGTVFEIPDTGGSYGTPITLANFGFTNGSGPTGDLIANGAGDLFGTTVDGGTGSDGTVFELTDTGFVLPCYRRGTRIATPTGERAIESLAVGDLVLTASGQMWPIAWIGRRRVDCRRHPKPEKVWPVRVHAGAFGDGMPRRDLWLSPDHAVFVDQVLIPVKCLSNGTSIAQVPVNEASYYHIELPHHEVLLAEGLPAESYLDVGQRFTFDNGGGPVALHADFGARMPDFAARMWEACGCAPLVVTGPELQAVRQRVNAIAADVAAAARHGRRGARAARTT
jgi:uncharacterized repeat protein (TIGR03803 family)